MGAIGVLASRQFLTAQDAAVFIVAFIGLERSEMLAVVGKLQSRGKGSPHQPERTGRGGLMGHHNPPSVSTDFSVVTGMGAASQEKGTSPQGCKPSPVPLSVQAAEWPRSRNATLPSATKSQGKVNRSLLCGTGCMSPRLPPPVTAQYLPTSALLLSSLHREVWQCTDSGARAGSGCSLAPITPHPTPPGSPSVTSRLLLCSQGFNGVENLLGTHHLSAELGRLGATFFGIQSDGERGYKAQSVSMEGTCSFDLSL